MPGGFAGSGDLIRMANLHDLRGQVDVTESELAKVHMGQRAELVPDAYPDRRYRAHVVKLYTSGGVVTQIEVYVNGQQKFLPVGSNCAVVLASSTIESTRLALESFATPRMGRNLMGHLRSNTVVRIKRAAFGPLPKDLQAAALLVRGSTPQRRGAKMILFENGNTAGTVGGGCVEAEVWAEAREAMRSGEPALHHFSLTADEASEEGMVCGGTMDIFIDVWKK